jgi:UTP--glucose-1-phosphate uridylyltransferase
MKYRKPTKAIITDAGFASRFLPWTKTNPKAMVPMGNKPIMQLVVEECAAAGIDDIIIVTTPEGKPIYEDYFTNGVNHVYKQLRSQHKLDRYKEVEKVLHLPKIRIIEQDQALPYGNGSPIVSARQFIADDEAFIVCYSDDIVLKSSDVATLIDSFAEHPDADAIIMAQDVDNKEVSKYGIVSLKDGDQLDNIVEKPEINEAPSTLASYGRYLLTPQIFEYLKPNKTGKDGELWTVDGITEIAKTGKVYVEPTKGQWRTTGDPRNYFMAQLEYVLENEDYADEVRAFVANH